MLDKAQVERAVKAIELAACEAVKGYKTLSVNISYADLEVLRVAASDYRLWLMQKTGITDEGDKVVLGEDTIQDTLDYIDEL
jgi:hypothetical protein